MATEYKHGVYIEELSTALQAMTEVATPAVVIGTAPIHLATNSAGSKPVLCTSMSDFVSQFGWSNDFESYTLCEAAQVFFQLYNVTPVIFINVLSAAKHGQEKTVTVAGLSNVVTLNAPMILSTLKISTGEKPVTASMIGVTGTEPITIPSKIDANNFTLTSGEVELILTTDYTISDGKIIFTEAGAEKCTGNLTFASGTDTYVELVADEDFTAAYNSKGEILLTIISQNKIVDDTISLEYAELDATKVTASDVIGGADIVTGENTGIELVEEIYPRFGVVPDTIIAPKFSTNPAVAATLHAKARSVNGIFRALGVADIDTKVARTYNDVNAIKNTKNYTDEFLAVTWPKVSLGGVQYHLSTHVAALMGQVDSEHASLPYKSPSNELLNVDSGILTDGTEVFLGRSQANFLNGQGVVTALNFNGWRCWGNRTGAYPSNIDVKDSFIPCRRTMNWISNSLVLNFLSQIDEPINKRQLESIVDRCNQWFNGLSAAGAILGGRVALLESENPATSLANGKVKIHVYVGLQPPMRELDFVVEFDVSYLNALVAA